MKVVWCKMYEKQANSCDKSENKNRKQIKDKRKYTKPNRNQTN